MTVQPIRLALVAERPLHADLLSSVLTTMPQVRLIGVARCADDLVRQLEDSIAPEMAVVSLDGSHKRGIKSIRQIRATFPKMRIITVGIDTDPSGAVECLEAGACCCLTRADGLDSLRRLIVNGCRNEPEISPLLLTSVIERIRELREERRARANSMTGELSPRELEVLKLVADGQVNKQIANHLAIETPTVKNHVHRVLQKLGARTRREAVCIGRDRGLIASHVAHTADAHSNLQEYQS